MSKKKKDISYEEFEGAYDRIDYDETPRYNGEDEPYYDDNEYRFGDFG